MRLSIERKSRVITIYLQNNLHFKKSRYFLLKQLAEEEDIVSSEKSMRRIVQKWLENGNIYVLYYLPIHRIYKFWCRIYQLINSFSELPIFVLLLNSSCLYF
jgi:hypothetical protein